MARNTLSIRMDLDQLICRDEGDGWGNAEPYLWTVFFKVDGSTISVSPALNLAGTAVLHTTPGSHGNLGTTDVDAGDTVTIPAAIGEWETDLRPIPLPPGLAGDVGGVIGVVTVLMEEDNVSDAGAQAGHGALNQGVRAAIDQIVATRSITNQEVSEEELAGFESQVSSAVEAAVINQQNAFENLWSWINPDDTIGFKVFMFTHDDLARQGTIAFSHRHRNEGDWELRGTITATAQCPVDVFDVLFGSGSSAAAPKERRAVLELEPFHRFRATTYVEHPGLAAWWRLAERNAPALALLLARDEDLRAEAAALWRWAAGTCNEPDAALDPEVLARAGKLLERVGEATRSRRLRIDASRMAELTRTLDGRTWGEGVKLLAGFRPARRPKLAGLGITVRSRELLATRLR